MRTAQQIGKTGDIASPLRLQIIELIDDLSNGLGFGRAAVDLAHAKRSIGALPQYQIENAHGLFSSRAGS